MNQKNIEALKSGPLLRMKNCKEDRHEAPHRLYSPTRWVNLRTHWRSARTSAETFLTGVNYHEIGE